MTTSYTFFKRSNAKEWHFSGFAKNSNIWWSWHFFCSKKFTDLINNLKFEDGKYTTKTVEEKSCLTE